MPIIHWSKTVAAKQNNSDDIICDINIVPLVDIILVVLIIFMVTSQVSQQQKKLDVDLPQASSGKSGDEKSMRVVLNSSGDLIYEGRIVSEFELRDLILEAIKSGSEIKGLLLADQKIEYGKAVKVLDWIKQAGLQNISIGVGEYQ